MSVYQGHWQLAPLVGNPNLAERLWEAESNGSQGTRIFVFGLGARSTENHRISTVNV